jgi:ActR/RegA family two-component response regulator
MRPRKVVLLAKRNEAQASMLKFMLETRGPFRVITASTKETALKVFDTWRVDLALLEFAAIAEEIRERDVDTRIVFFGGTGHPSLPHNAAPADVLSMVQLHTARKRGPKKLRVAA